MSNAVFDTACASRMRMGCAATSPISRSSRGVGLALIEACHARNILSCVGANSFVALNTTPALSPPHLSLRMW